MEQKRTETEFNFIVFPINLLAPVWLDAEKGLQRIIAWGLVAIAKSHFKNQSENLVVDNLLLHFGFKKHTAKEMLDLAEKVQSDIDNYEKRFNADVRVNIPAAWLLKCYDSIMSVPEFAMLTAIRSLLFKRDYIYTTKNVLLMRMFGAKKTEALTFLLDYWEIQRTFKKNSSRFKIDKLLANLQSESYLPGKISQKRRLVISLKTTNELLCSKLGINQQSTIPTVTDVFVPLDQAPKLPIKGESTKVSCEVASHKSLSTYNQNLLENAPLRELIYSQHMLSRSKYAQFANDFYQTQEALKAVYPGQTDYEKHFLNWINVRLNKSREKNKSSADKFPVYQNKKF